MPQAADSLGGRYGSQAYYINRALVSLGQAGGTPEEVQAAMGVLHSDAPLANVSAQLSWLFSRALIDRRRNTQRGSRNRFVYFAAPRSNYDTSLPSTATARSIANANAPAMRFRPVADRTFGIELEIVVPGTDYVVAQQSLLRAMQIANIPCVYEGYTHATRAHWKLVTDGTVHASAAQVGRFHGYELVSPILRGAEGEETVRKVCAVLHALGVRVNRRCGMHVHVGNTGIDNVRKRKLFETYGALERFIDQFMPPSRRAQNNMHCRSCVRAEYGATRYYKLNASMNERTHPTIEFRQHSGTVEAYKVLSWVRFCQAFTNCVDLDGLAASTSLSEMLTKLELSTQDQTYFMERAEDLSAELAAA